jgi:hypothetical protein
VTAGPVLCFLLLANFMLNAVSIAEQESVPQKKEDTFFAGTVASWDTEKIVVARSVAAKNEQRTFKMTPATKVEGKLRAKVRVTVRYTTDDSGDTATLIVVRAPAKAK